LDPASDNLFVHPYDFTFDVTLTNLSVTEAGSKFTTNGVLTLSEATDANAVIFNTTLSGNSLTVKTSLTTDTLEDFLIVAGINQGTGAYTTDSSGTLASTLLGGIVDFLTTSLFTGFGSDFPDTGEMVITGDTIVGGVGPSSVTVQAVDRLCVDLLVDENGDGGTDSDILTTWESLQIGTPVDCVPL
jgi:hypothetical protein